LPELPEVETTRCGVSPHIKNNRVTEVIVRQKKLRWEVSPSLSKNLVGNIISDVSRRGKYLLFESMNGTMLIHLGMSGSLRIIEATEPAGKHDHVDLILENGNALRYTDPRRFGCVLWQKKEEGIHPLLLNLGPEPLSEEFDCPYLYRKSRGRAGLIKSFIMDSKIVVGVGNIYANEALFLAGISPKRAAGNISKARYENLVLSIRKVLERAIEAGGTTLRDFTNSSGEPGYFKQSLNVYGRGGGECRICKTPLKEIRISQRSTVYCPSCQH
jgi:formamidopyrimidine-DNA glycosylase